MEQWLEHTLKEKTARQLQKTEKGQKDLIMLDVSVFYLNLEAHNFHQKKEIPLLVQMPTQGGHSEKLRKIPTPMSAL